MVCGLGSGHTLHVCNYARNSLWIELCRGDSDSQQHWDSLFYVGIAICMTIMVSFIFQLQFPFLVMILGGGAVLFVYRLRTQVGILRPFHR